MGIAIVRAEIQLKQRLFNLFVRIGIYFEEIQVR
jgi:hypothetical protein